MAREQRNALPKGYALDEFTIEHVLGAGSFGITYRALEEKLGRRVAIKEYLPGNLAMRGADGSSVHPVSSQDKGDYDYGLGRFRDEARTLVNFHHPNIVTVHRFLEANGTAYLVMQYVEGESLYDILERDRRLPEHELREILIPLLDGLEKVHEAGFLHRDIKPGNIFIQADGTPVLLDFGAARQALGEKSQSMTSIVTAGYAPFEQYASRGRQGAWTDLYAMGATLYRAVTGAKPADAPDRIAGEAFVPAVEAGKGRYSTGFLEAIDWALKMEASERPQSVAEWRAVFGQAPARQARRAARPGGRRLGIAAALVVLAAAGAGAWVALAPPKEAALAEPPRAETGRAAKEKRAAEEVEARRKAAREAGRRAAEEAKRKALEEARRKAAEAKRKAAEEARRKAEEEMRKAAEEAKRKAAEEARRKAEEAKRKAQEEARKKAEEAKRKTQEEARRQAEEARRRAAAKKGAIVASDGAPKAKTPREKRIEELERRAKAAKKPQQAAAGVGANLRTLFVGARTNMKRKFILHGSMTYVLNFGSGGRLTGTSEEALTSQVGNEIYVSDSGKWWVSGGRLCLKWSTWDDAKTLCYTIKGGGSSYTASGARGILTGGFRLSK